MNPGVVVDGTNLEVRNLVRAQAKLGITAGGVPVTRRIDTTAPLTGGGDLSADRTHSMPQSSAAQDGFLSAADFATFAAGIGITQLTGDVTAGPGTGSQAATIAADAVTNAKLADMPASTIKGNNTAGALNPLDLTVAQVRTLLNSEVVLTFTPPLTRTVNTVAWTGTTTDVPEGANLYYTAARFNTAFAGKSTTDLAEGTNLYYTQARFDTAFAAKSTTNLAEGTNLYYTQARFDTAFAAKSTTNLAEGTNLYYTAARAAAAVSGNALAMLRGGIYLS